MSASGVPYLRAVDADLPDYPSELCDPALATDYFTVWWHDRWLSSRLHLQASQAVQGAALNLFFLARKQTPVGSLPADEALLARLLRVAPDEWRGLMAQPLTPLHRWQRYAHDGDVVLGHPVVIEVALAALHRREDRESSRDDRAVAMRRRRLVEIMRAEGCAPAMCQDWQLVCRIDDWLAANHQGQRRQPQVGASLRRALQHATAMGWIGGGSARR